MTYDEAIQYIHTRSNFFCKPGLERTRELCEGLGNPQKNLKFIHIGGTNGKGSFCAMTDSILRAAGYKVGLFTSPYVLEFNERMRVDGKNISNGTLARLTERAKSVADTMTDSPTEFELITAIAFLYFKEENCDVVVLEVGMGGRLDATNIIDQALLSVITGIAIDHTAFLGDTVEKIAAEKAGIIKPHSTLVFGGNNAAAETVILDNASKMQAKVYKPNYPELKITSTTLNGTIFNYGERDDLKISLLGSYQPRNAAIVLCAVDILKGLGLKIGEEAIRQGLAQAKWPARFEIIGHSPIVIFDGAHNPQGIRAAVDSIKSYFKDRKVVVFTGVLRDKDYREIASNLSEVASEAFTITPQNPRALDAKEYATVLQEYGVNATPCHTTHEAIALGIEAAIKTDTALCCLGSLYTYGEVIEAIRKNA